MEVLIFSYLSTTEYDDLTPINKVVVFWLFREFFMNNLLIFQDISKVYRNVDSNV